MKFLVVLALVLNMGAALAGGQEDGVRISCDSMGSNVELVFDSHGSDMTISAPGYFSTVMDLKQTFDRSKCFAQDLCYEASDYMANRTYFIGMPKTAFEKNSVFFSDFRIEYRMGWDYRIIRNMSCQSTVY